MTLTLGQANPVPGKKAGEGSDHPAGVVSVALVSDAQIAELNQRYLGRDGPTDVLAFNLSEGEPQGQERVWGEVVISVDTARRQASGSLEKEICLLAVHGTLHLLGWEDDTPESWQQMMAETHRLLDLITGNGWEGEC